MKTTNNSSSKVALPYLKHKIWYFCINKHPKGPKLHISIDYLLLLPMNNTLMVLSIHLPSHVYLSIILQKCARGRGRGRVRVRRRGRGRRRGREKWMEHYLLTL